LPFDQVIVPETGRMMPRKVNVDGEAYECARRYMIRLEPQDFQDVQRLTRLAAAAGMTAEQFRQRFGYLVGQG
jgi:6-phosphofructokinase 1